MTSTENATNRLQDEWEERLARDYEEWEAFAQTVADGKLYLHLAEHGKPRPEDVARIMREGPRLPEMTIDGWLVKGELHWIFADAEAGKTWLALWLSVAVMARGGTVVYFDEELGRDAIAQRLIDLGADPDVVEKQFVYCPFPSWQIGSSAEPTEPDMHRDALRALKGDLQLVVYDTVTDALAEAGMDENSGVDVTRWVKAYPEEARKLGAAALVLDHTGKSNGDTAVGSRAKRAKAKVQFKLKSSGRFDRDTTNEVVVTLKKNTSGAVGIPDRRVFKVGGDGEGHFLWEPMFASTGELKTAVTANRIRTDLVARIGNLPGVTQRNLFANVPGETKAKGSELAWLISDGTVRVEPGARNSICHFLSSTATDVG